MDLAVLDGLNAEMVLVLWMELLVLMEWYTWMELAVQWLVLENRRKVDDIAVELAGRKLEWYLAMALPVLLWFGAELEVVEPKLHL